jgi:hypothetical protein
LQKNIFPDEFIIAKFYVQINYLQFQDYC